MADYASQLDPDVTVMFSTPWCGYCKRLMLLMKSDGIPFVVVNIEADPAAGRISVASPLGKALLGLKRGDVARFLAPRGEMQFKVLAVELPEKTRRAARHVRKGQ